MSSDSFEDIRECSHFDCPMHWNAYVMFTVYLRRHIQMGTTLANRFVAETTQRPLELFAADVSRQAHRARISSLTK